MANKAIRDPGSIRLRQKRMSEHTSGEGDAHAQEEARARKSAIDRRSKAPARKTSRSRGGSAGRSA